MGVKTYEEMLEETRDVFKDCLIKDAGSIGRAMHVAKTSLDLCTNEFEEQTLMENLKEVFEEVMDELRKEEA